MANTETDWREGYTEADEVDPRDVDWYTPGSPDFEVAYAVEYEDID